MRILPEMWASTLWPFSSSTRNMALGSGSTTVPSSTIASSLGLGRWTSWTFRPRTRHRPWNCPGDNGHASSPWARQHLRAVVGDRDGVLEMGRETAVGGLHGPAVVHEHRLGLSGVHHGLDGEDVT